MEIVRCTNSTNGSSSSSEKTVFISPTQIVNKWREELFCKARVVRYRPTTNDRGGFMSIRKCSFNIRLTFDLSQLSIGHLPHLLYHLLLLLFTTMIPRSHTDCGVINVTNNWRHYYMPNQPLTPCFYLYTFSLCWYIIITLPARWHRARPRLITPKVVDRDNTKFDTRFTHL